MKKEINEERKNKLAYRWAVLAFACAMVLGVTVIKQTNIILPIFLGVASILYGPITAALYLREVKNGVFKVEDEAVTKKAIRSKNIYTGVSEQLVNGYVVSEEDKIIFIGDETSAKPYIDDDTEIFNFENNFVMPGLHDFHVHLIVGALMERDGILRNAKSEDEAVQILWEKNKEKPGDQWIMGGAWDNFKWTNGELPTKTSLDKYFKDVPVFLLNKECHGAWANSEALRRFNITKDTPDPENGSYYRDEDGEPTGYIHEAALIPMLEAIMREMDAVDLAEYAKSFARVANEYGITSVGDLPLYGIRADHAYKILEDKGELNIRINFAVAFKEEMEEILNAREDYTSDLLQFIGTKDFLDGTPMGHTGFMLDDYTDMPGFRSKGLIEPEYLKNRVAELTDKGIKVRLHACGDAAVQLGLDAFEFAKEKYGDKDLRHCIEHIEAISPKDIKRFGELSVIASVQPDHLPKYDFYNHPFHTMIGDDRMQYSWPFKSIMNLGGKLAFGTDYPVAELNPFRSIFRAVTRLTDELEPEGGFSPQEKLSVHESLKAYTYGSAYAAGRDEETGTLEKGKLADIAVVEHNIFDCATEKDTMFNMDVLMTVVGGKIVYSK